MKKSRISKKIKNKKMIKIQTIKIQILIIKIRKSLKKTKKVNQLKIALKYQKVVQRDW